MTVLHAVMNLEAASGVVTFVRQLHTALLAEGIH